MEKNAYVVAIEAMQNHIAAATKGQKSEADLTAELMKLRKEDLVAELIKHIKVERIKVEDVVKPILEDERCSWLTMDDIATAVAESLKSKTSPKSIASYASKYPDEKGWIVVPRKSNAARQAEIKKMLGI